VLTLEPKSPPHNDAPRRIEAAGDFIRDDPQECRTEIVGRDHFEAEPRVNGMFHGGSRNVDRVTAA